MKRQYLVISLTLAILLVVAVGLMQAQSGDGPDEPVASAGLSGPPAEPLAVESAPTMINYQGVVEVGGGPYDGVGYFKFAIMDAASGNGTTNYWANDGTGSGEPSDSVPATVTEGLFNVLLGSGMTGIDYGVFSGNTRYLRVWFSTDGSTFEALEPNQRVASGAYSLQAQNADMVDGYHASSSPTANQLVTLDGNAYLRVPRVLDSNNTVYYVDPASLSILSDLRANSLVDRNNTSYYVDPAGNSSLSYVYTNRLYDLGSASYYVDPAGSSYLATLYANILYDRNNTGYYVNPAVTSNMNLVKALNFGVNGNEATAAFYAADSATKDIDRGVRVNSADISGVSAAGLTQGGWFEDQNTTTYTRIAYGSYSVSGNGAKAFVQQHPSDPDKVIIYISLEGGEAGTYHRGSAQLANGTATIQLPEHFGLVTEEEGLTVQVTPREDCNGLYVAEVTTTRMVVKELQGGTSNARFDFFINGIRAGYKDHEPLQSAPDIHSEGTSLPEPGDAQEVGQAEGVGSND